MVQRLQSVITAPFMLRLAKSIDDAMQLANRYGCQHLDFGHAVILFVLSLVEMLIDCILDDCGLLNISTHEHGNIYTKNMDFGGKGPHDRGDEHREHLRRKNILMSIEVVEKATANKIAQVFLRLVYLNTPENFNYLLRKLQLIGALESKNVLPAYNLLDSLTMNIQNVISTRYQLDRSRLLGVLLSTQPCSSSVFSIFGAGKGSCWVPFDMFMENAMDGRHLHAISSVEFLTELSKTLQVLNRATWQETFQALWISGLRLVQRGPEALEGPFPHLYSRLCMLLAIIPLSVATIVKEEVDKLDGGMVSAIKEELVSSLQILVQFSGLLSPPPATVHFANTAARKAAIVLSNLKSGNENLYGYSKDSSAIKAVGNMLHLIVEACIARNLIDTSAYFWPGYVVPLEASSQAQESPWSSLTEGSPLVELKDALMVTPASSVAELEKLYSFAVSGSEEEKLAASKVLCGASLLRGWNIQEHVVQIVLKLLSSFLPLDSGSDGRYVQHMPMLHALISGISSVDAVHILSMYGLVPEVAAMLMPLCEIFGSLPPSDHRSCNFEKASVYSVFSSAFLSLLRLWKFHRPPIENALSRHGVFVRSELSLDFLLLLRNSRSALKNLSNVSKSSIFQLDPSLQKPVYIDSFPKLRAWYFQNQACIASTLSTVYNRPNVLHVANNILKIICHKVPKDGILSVNPQSTSNSSMGSSPPPGVPEDMCQWPTLPAWDVLEAIPFVLEAVLTACAHGRLSSRDLITGLRDLADFLPASLAAIVSYFSAEITRGIWKPVMLNGTDWPSPAATLPVVESEINEVLAKAGVNINISSRPRSVMPMLPLPIAALISLSITVKMEEFSHLHGIIGQGIEICATSSSWPSMQIIGALWSQKVRRWHDFIILACSQSPFTRDNTAVSQLIRSCFTSFLGPLVDGRSCYVANRGVADLLGKTLDERARLVVAPGFLYMRSCRLFPDNNFVCEEILKVVIERARALANDCSSERPGHLRSDCMPLSAASSLVEQISSLAATMLCHAGGLNLIRLLYEHILPTLLLSAGEDKLGSAGHVCSLFEGYALAYVLLWSGASIWGVGETSPAYASIYTSKRQRIVDRHLEFMAKVMEGNIVLGCGETTWRSYVLCFVGLLVDFVPAWILEVKLETLQKLASGLRKWHKGDLALSLLERGGNKAVTSVVESLLGYAGAQFSV
ncbi:mediator of RNA polymerase II transcription subunit 33A-like isoform X3 [Panicum hallii]|uniref:mediator of RNA polymerase II transcription subunit 33A-like isoform X3 n=1 Tax=Panicum hallii TaxID=206008 RepID=UPI000DF4DD16|nr:mediator of RNA polymerase II transcription subunit 33A-like isoform X3 [Panicum hallii]